MKRSDIQPLPEHFGQYILLEDDSELADVLQQNLEAVRSLDKNKLTTLGDKVYAPNKWTVKEVLQHITDTERIFCYRALVIARGDINYPPGFDEQLYAKYSGANERSIDSLLAELIAVKNATIAMFESFSDTTLQKTGLSSKYEMSVLALGFAIAGHQTHHLKIIAERYFPLCG